MKQYLVSTSMRCRLKYVIMFFLPSFICVKIALITTSSIAMYIQNGITVIAAFITGGEDKYFLMSSKTRC
jgi:hypothetical protein